MNNLIYPADGGSPFYLPSLEEWRRMYPLQDKDTMAMPLNAQYNGTAAPLPTEARVVTAETTTTGYANLAVTSDPRKLKSEQMANLGNAIGGKIAELFGDQVQAAFNFNQEAVKHQLALVVLRPSEFATIVHNEAQKLLGRASKL